MTRIISYPLPQVQLAAAPRLRLPWDQRVKTRLALMLDDGEAVAIILPRGSVLRDGALLGADDGRIAIVVAALQPLLRITAAAPGVLLRAVYHLANRHVAAQLAPDQVLVERDPVLAAMLRGLGACVEDVEAAFDPEPGAYGAHGAHGAHGAYGAHGVHGVHGAHGVHGVPPQTEGRSDDPSATLGEQLSIEAHRRAAAAPGAPSS